MTINLKFLTLILAACATAAMYTSCKKDTQPQATIYVLDQDLNPLVNMDVHFYIEDASTAISAIDTTIPTDERGAATLKLKHEAFLDVNLKYMKADKTFASAETSARFIKNEHFVDTLIIQY